MRSNAQRQREQRAMLQAIVKGYKSRPCAICGVQYPPCAMDFHHTQDNKRDSVATLVGNGCSVGTVLTEINKCIIVCAVCHRVLHFAEEE